jgi:hypothetical protein
MSRILVAIITYLLREETDVPKISPEDPIRLPISFPQPELPDPLPDPPPTTLPQPLPVEVPRNVIESLGTLQQPLRDYVALAVEAELDAITV